MPASEAGSTSRRHRQWQTSRSAPRLQSLGCVLYELCSLQHAFRADNLLGLVYQISLGQYDPLPPGYSTPLHVLVSQLLEREPDLRPGLAQVMATPIVQASLGALQGQGSGAGPASCT